MIIFGCEHQRCEFCHPPIGIDICFISKKKFYGISMSISSSPCERRITILTFCINICAMIQKNPDYIGISIFCSKHKRCITINIFSIYVSTMLKKNFNHIWIIINCRQHQSRVVITHVSGIYINPSCEKVFDPLRITFFYSGKKGIAV